MTDCHLQVDYKGREKTRVVLLLGNYFVRIPFEKQWTEEYVENRFNVTTKHLSTKKRIRMRLVVHSSNVTTSGSKSPSSTMTWSGDVVDRSTYLTIERSSGTYESSFPT